MILIDACLMLAFSSQRICSAFIESREKLCTSQHSHSWHDNAFMLNHEEPYFKMQPTPKLNSARADIPGMNSHCWHVEKVAVLAVQLREAHESFMICMIQPSETISFNQITAGCPKHDPGLAGTLHVACRCEA